jgi:hypothetical protein
LKNQPWLEPVLAQLAPFLIVVANIVLRMILEFLSSFEGPISGAVVQASLFVKLAAFMIIQTFLVSAISGSLFSQFSAMLQGKRATKCNVRRLLAYTQIDLKKDNILRRY